MADLAKTVGIIFKGEDKASAAARSVEDAIKGIREQALGATGGLEQFSGNLRDATQPMADLAAGALKFEAGLLAAGAAVTVFAVKTAGDFDTAFRQIATLFDASDEGVAKFRADILDFAATSSKPIKDITDALQAAIGSGVDYTRSLDLIAVAEKLAVATRADLKGTTEVLVSTLNAYGMKTEDAGRLSDLFFQTIKDGKVEMNELAHSFAMVTPLAAASGVSIEEIGAAVATLTAAGVPAGQAIEYLRSLLTNIVKPSKDASDMAEELGIKFDAATLKSKGLSGVLLDVGKAVEGDTGKMSKLVGDVGGLVAALALTGPQAEKFAEILVNMGKSAGATDAAFEKMAGSLDVASQKVFNGLKALLINIGTPLLDEFGGVANAIAKVFAALGDSVKGGALGGLVAYVEGVVGGIEKTLATVAVNLPAALAKADLSGFTRGLDAIGAAFGVLFGGTNLATVDGLTKAIELAGAAFLGLGKFVGGVIESFKPLLDALVSIANQAGKLNPQFFEIAGNISGAALQINKLAEGVKGLITPLEALLELMLLKQGLGLLGGFKGLTQALPALVGQITTFGVAAATYFATDKVIDLVKALSQWKDATDHLAKAQQQGADVQTAAIPTLEKFAQTTGIAVQSIDDANALVAKGAVVWDEAINGWVKAAEAQEKTVDASDKQKQAVLRSAEAMMVAADRSAAMAQAQEGVGKAAAGVRTIIDAATGKIIGYEQAHASAAKSSQAAGDRAVEFGEKSARGAEKAREAAAKMALELEKLASNERIKLIEARVTLNVAEIEAQTKRIQAAFESVSKTIDSTGDVIGDALGAIKDVLPNTQAFDVIQQQLEVENKLRRDAFELQKELTKAQVDNMRAQTAALLRGDAIIKIDGAGLQPHLEAFMWEILKAVQVRVNQQGLGLLLGTP